MSSAALIVDRRRRRRPPPLSLSLRKQHARLSPRLIDPGLWQIGNDVRRIEQAMHRRRDERARLPPEAGPSRRASGKLASAQPDPRNEFGVRLVGCENLGWKGKRF